MSLWGNKDQASNAPKFKINPDSPLRGPALYGTQIIGWHAGDLPQHRAQNPGWQQITYGRGPLAGLTMVVGGSGYSNTDRVRVAGAAGSVNASATLVTNATGGIVSVAVSNVGGKFVNTSTTSVSIFNANNTPSVGSGATFTFKLGGRANRITMETLVTQTSMKYGLLTMFDRTGKSLVDRNSQLITSRV